MLKQARNFFNPPVFPEDEDKTRKARYANAIAIIFLAVAVFYETIYRFFVHYTGLTFIDLPVIGVAIICAVALVLLRKGHVRFTSVLLVVITWIAANGLSANGFGIRDSSYVLNFAIVLMAGLLLSWQAALVATFISVLSGFGLAYAENNGLIKVVSYALTSFAVDMAFIFVINAALIGLLINGLENALKKSRTNLEELEAANMSLNYTQSELSNRSAELLIANNQLENRAKKLRAVAEVTRSATSLRDFDHLLSSITSIISSQLGYHHVAIFLVDEQQQYAILRSANTELGLIMLSRGYRVPVGQLGIVSTVAQTGQPRIALDLGEQKMLLNELDIAGTRSQLALPLKSGDKTIGVLDIQSVEADDFTEEDIATLSILADQVGIAIQNALLFEESQRALQEANAQSLQASERAWNSYAAMIKMKGYRYDGIKSEPWKDAKLSGQERDTLLIPVQLRGQTIGRLKLNPSDRSHEWSDDELVMVRATAERVALALEGARLLEEAQKRATREAFLSDIAAKLSTSFQLDSILRDTVQELGETLKNSTVTFQLVNPAQSGALKVERANGNSAPKQDSDVDDE
jgi:GAF domain-containing protein